MVREIYSLRETLTKNFEVNSTNVTESNERTNTRTNEHTNGRTDKRQGENYIPRGINAGGIINIKVLLILHTKFQPNIPSRSGENDDFISFAIFSDGGHLEFSTRLNFTILKPWSLIMLHVKLEIHRCSGFKEKVI